jgi:hypothetical protein
MSRARSGGGATTNKVVETTTGRKAEPISHPVSMNRPSMIGASTYFEKPPLYYNKVTASTPKGPNHNFEVGAGAGRQILPHGTQSASRTTPMKPGRSLFK